MSRAFGNWADATPENMRTWTEEDLHAAMVQNNGGVYDAWARAEIERRHMKALQVATEQVHQEIARLTASSTTLEVLTTTLKNLTWALMFLTILAAILTAVVPIGVEIWKGNHEPKTAEPAPPMPAATKP